MLSLPPGPTLSSSLWSPGLAIWYPFLCELMSGDVIVTERALFGLKGRSALTNGNYAIIFDWTERDFLSSLSSMTIACLGTSSSLLSFISGAGFHFQTQMWFPSLSVRLRGTRCHRESWAVVAGMVGPPQEGVSLRFFISGGRWCLVVHCGFP